MNYFELLDVPLQYNIDLPRLKEKYVALSRQHHPDYHGNKNLDEQNDATSQSIKINGAYTVLKNNAKRLKYLLDLQEVLMDIEKYTLPGDFLMEMMDLNEEIEQLQINNKLTTTTTINNKVNELQNELEKVAAQVDWTKLKEADVINLKENYCKLKYMLRIQESLNTFVAR